MAWISPDIAKNRVVFASTAEERLYRVLMEQLGPRWKVFYSLVLSEFEGEQGLVDNEIDFLLYHPSYGAIAIEVKGGRIGYDPEKQAYFTINRQDKRFEIKNPFQQALVWKNRFVRFLKKRDIRIPVSYAVSFPSISESEIQTNASSAHELVIGRESLDHIEKKLKEIVKASQPEKFLKFRDIGSQLEDVLVGEHFTAKFHLRDYIDVHENRVRDVESIQESFLTPIIGTKRLGIEGEAGTGKTMLATMLAAELHKSGSKVLLLTSNEQLNDMLKDRLNPEIEILTYEQWAATFGVSLFRPDSEFKGSKEDWIQFEAPDRLLKKVQSIETRYDAIICDEAQDAKPFWWDSIQAALKDKDESRLYIFFDRSQGVFATGDTEKFVPESTLPVAQPYFPLVHNYRTTKEIATFARQFRTGGAVLASHSSRLGYLPEIYRYKDVDDLHQKLAALVSQLTEKEGVLAEELTILSARKPQAPESAISGLTRIGKNPLRFLQTAKKSKTDSVKENTALTVTTISGFKGLESAVGIIVNLSEYKLPLHHPLMASLLYVALTRARHMLYIFVREDDSKHELLTKALSQVPSVGGLIVDPTDDANELVGTVVHYNPQRVGWLKIETASITRSEVMFFPFDIEKSGLSNVRVGEKLKFRIRSEGDLAIAVDIKSA